MDIDDLDKHARTQVTNRRQLIVFLISLARPGSAFSGNYYYMIGLVARARSVSDA